MREVMRRSFDELWVLDLGGEGRGTRKSENVFDIMVPVAICTAIRLPGNDGTRYDTPAVVHYRLVTGTRAEKFAALDGIEELNESDEWRLAPSGWLDKFLPDGTEDFDSWPLLSDIFSWQHSGMQFKRTWPIAETRDVAVARWKQLVTAPVVERPALLRQTGDRQVAKPQKALLSKDILPAISSLTEESQPETITRYGFRSFDRQWCIGDNRVADRPRPELWHCASGSQVFFVTLNANPLGAGPALTVSAYVPDLHFFRGSYGAKDVMPLWKDANATIPNIPANILTALRSAYGSDVAAEDLAAYIFGLLGTGAYTDRFQAELATSAPRVPITADWDLFSAAVELGRRLIWLGTFAERFAPAGVKGKAAHQIPSGKAKNTVAVKAGKADYPTSFSYDPATSTIHVGSGDFSPVEPKVWEFEVSGLRVVTSWLAYRMKEGAGRTSSALDAIRPEHWTFSMELVELLAVIEQFVEATPKAAALLEAITAGTVIETLPAPTTADRGAPATSSTEHQPSFPF